MTNGPATPVYDLVALVPGRDDRETLDSLLTARRQELGIRDVTVEILVHPNRDPGCYQGAEEILRPYHNRSRHALTLFDHEGCGQENRSPDEIASDVEARLRANGWGERAAVFVITPELETWLWVAPEVIASHLEWNEDEDVPDWLAAKDLWPVEQPKPSRPKEAFEAVLRQTRQRRSSSIYRRLAEDLPLATCRDPVFRSLRAQLAEWFSS